MVKGKTTIKKPLDHFAIRSTSERVQVNDTVLMRNQNSGKPSYIGKVETMWIDGRNNPKVQVRWYYRPEETIAGRREFHGAKEVFLSDHIDVQSVETIEGKCYVHTFKSYTQLPNVSPKDFFCRFTYEAATGIFLPDRVAVYCICEMPYNPDDLMMQCQACKNWFHPACLGMTIEQARKLHQFYCKECSISMASKDSVKTAISDSKSVLDKVKSQ